MQLKHLILVALCVCVAYSATVTPCTATVTGGVNVVKFGQCQLCHPSCLTCTTGTGTANCATCAAGLGVPAGASAACACAANAVFTTSTTVLACAATTSTDVGCPGALGYFFATTPACTRANWKFKAPVEEAADKCKISAAAGVGCWGQAICSGTGACDYGTAKSYVLGCELAMTSTDTVPGYFHDTATNEFMPCALGCMTCTSATVCTGCAGEWKPKATQTTDACECPADGAFGTACTKNDVTNCKTQTETLKCVTCDDLSDINDDKTKCVLKPTTTTTTGTTVILADAPAKGCATTQFGCSKCDEKDEKICTTCLTAKNWELDATANACKCLKDFIGSTTKKEDCGLACTACKTGEVASLDTATVKCKCIAGTTTDAAATTSGMLLTVASMVMAVILA